MRKNKNQITFTALLAIALAVFFFLQQYSKANTPAGEGLRVWFFDVGQGDGIFFRTAEGVDVLIDGGPGSSVIEKLAKVLPAWDKQIDYVFLTHPHADHLEGLIEVLQRYEVSNFIESGFVAKTAGYERLEKEAMSGGEKKIIAKTGDRFDFGSDVTAEVFWPEPGILSSATDTNDSSIVMKLSYGEIDFLLTGDATETVEKGLLDDDLNSEFLKVAHHGSRYASTTAFLQKASPLVSFISSGKGNTYGHPAPEALQRLITAGSRVLRTDLSGTIEVEVGRDGRWKIVCEKTCK
ncbi:MBL fold metallo-hydrolase [Candidatus Microgenomates bacterium]|nr:MBL fold metallo-hydrolase [Candidatus Microgenomates bacterium]